MVNKNIGGIAMTADVSILLNVLNTSIAVDVTKMDKRKIWSKY
jgi:hypothetical protein